MEEKGKVTLASLYDDCRDYPDGHKRVEDFLYGLVKIAKGRVTGIRLRGRDEKYVVFDGTAIGRPLGIYVRMGDDPGPRKMLEVFLEEVLGKMRSLGIAWGYEKALEVLRYVMNEKTLEPAKAEAKKTPAADKPVADFSVIDRETLEKLLRKNFPAAVKFFCRLVILIIEGRDGFVFQDGRLIHKGEPLLSPQFYAVWARVGGINAMSDHFCEYLEKLHGLANSSLFPDVKRSWEKIAPWRTVYRKPVRFRPYNF